MSEPKKQKTVIEELNEKKQEVLQQCDEEIRHILKKYNANFTIDPNSSISNPKIILILNN